MGAASSFALLKNFAQETSSDGRRDLLRRATDVFLAEGGDLSSEQMSMLDDVVESVASDLSAQVRAELSRKISAAPVPFTRTARRLAMDDIEIAQPVLEYSRALTQSDLLDVIAQKSSDHMMAVTRRDDIGETVSNALVERGEDRVVASLLENRTAQISEQTYERVAARVESSTALQSPFVRREGVPFQTFSASLSARSHAWQQVNRYDNCYTDGSARRSASTVASTSVCPEPSWPGWHDSKMPHRRSLRLTATPFLRRGNCNRPRPWVTATRSCKRTFRRSVPSPRGESPP